MSCLLYTLCPLTHSKWGLFVYWSLPLRSLPPYHMVNKFLNQGVYLEFWKQNLFYICVSISNHFGPIAVPNLGGWGGEGNNWEWGQHANNRNSGCPFVTTFKRIYICLTPELNLSELDLVSYVTISMIVYGVISRHLAPPPPHSCPCPAYLV